MILANTRYHLTRGDAELVARLIARDSGEELAQVEQQLCDHGIDAVLDDPRLPSAMLRSGQGACASLPLFAYVMVRHALRRLGEEDRMLADYVASVFLHFGVRDRAYRVADSDDQVYDTLGSRLSYELAIDSRAGPFVIAAVVMTLAAAAVTLSNPRDPYAQKTLKRPRGR